MGKNGNSICKAKVYSVEVNDTTSLCRNISTNTNIDVVDLATPSISLTGNTFSVANPVGGVTYVWYVSGNQVSTGSTLLAGSSGYYTVVATDPGSGCTSDSSNTILYTAVGVGRLANWPEAPVVPNPNQGSFYALSLTRCAPWM
ncbi:MAG: hypothetical protein R3B47_04095 [Bacteroidia bacterium]